jgi:hypothetical protein
LNASVRDVSNLESSVALVPGMEQTDIYDSTKVINAHEDQLAIKLQEG